MALKIVKFVEFGYPTARESWDAFLAELMEGSPDGNSGTYRPQVLP